MTDCNLIHRRRFLREAGSLGALFAASSNLAQAPRKTILEMARAADKLEGVDIVDVHGHIHYAAANLIRPQDSASLLEDMDRCGGRVAIVSHLAALDALTPDDLVAATEDTARAVRKHPTRLRGYIVFHPHQLETSRTLMQRLLDPDSSFAGFKLHGAFHRYPAEGPNYKPAFAFANDYKLAVLFHVGGIGRDWSYSIGHLADTYPGMNMILAHLAPGEEALPALMKGRRNLFVDTCLTTARHRQIERLVAKIGAEKVLFATDAAFNSCVAGYSKIAFADLPDAEKRLVFGANARRVFGNRIPG